MRGNRSPFVITLTLVLTLVMLPMSGQRSTAPPANATPATDVVGTGWFTALACAGCLAIGISIVSTGPAGILAAMHVPGSAVAAGACVGACVDALTD